MSPAFRAHLIGWGMTLIAWALLWLLMGYTDSFLWLNSWRWSFMDIVMPHFTHVGDGLIISVAIGVWLWYRRKNTAEILGLIVAMLLLGLLIFIAKHYLFADWDRPFLRFVHQKAFFEISLYRLQRNSFPSGHSAAVVGACAMGAYYFRRFSTGLGLWLLAGLGAYSRVYIGVHFVGDIVVGSLIGLLCAWGTGRFVHPQIERWLIERPGFERWLRQGMWHLLGWVGMIAVAYLIWRYYLDPLIIWDRALFSFINGMHAPWADQIMWTLSSKTAWIPFYGYLLWRLYQKWGWPQLGIILLGIGLLILATDQVSASLLKPWIGRFRPCRPEAGLDWTVHLVHQKCGGLYGFVSSHASNFFGLVGFLTPLLGRRLDHWLLWLAAILVAYSRVYLGVHYPGDVLGGMLLGLAVGQFLHLFWRRWLQPHPID